MKSFYFAILVTLMAIIGASHQEGSLRLRETIDRETYLYKRSTILARAGVKAIEENEWKILGVASRQEARVCSKELQDAKIVCTPANDQSLALLDGVDASALPPGQMEKLKPYTTVFEKMPHSSPNSREITFLTRLLRKTQLNHVGILKKGTLSKAAKAFLFLDTEGSRCRDWEINSGDHFVLFNINCRVYKEKPIKSHLFYLW